MTWAARNSLFIPFLAVNPKSHRVKILRMVLYVVLLLSGCAPGSYAQHYQYPTERYRSDADLPRRSEIFSQPLERTFDAVAGAVGDAYGCGINELNWGERYIKGPCGFEVINTFIV